jgi:hypothetical protein
MLTAHRGLATWGERLVPLDVFRRAARGAGRRLPEDARDVAIATFMARRLDPTPVEGPFQKIAVFGSVHGNHLGLQALLDAAHLEGCEAIYCLGDLGGFGPNPEKVWPLLLRGDVRTVQGNYEQALAEGREDGNCGYTDPRDNHFEALSYRYTAERTSREFKAWMGKLPTRRRVLVGAREYLLAHGSPRRTNEFLFDSATASGCLESLCAQERVDGFLVTHSGLPWKRELESGRQVVNVGVLGRPANDGTTSVWWSILEASPDGTTRSELRRLDYDHAALAKEMRTERLPEEFVKTVLSGWWTTCLEILPAKERAAGKF